MDQTPSSNQGSPFLASARLNGGSHPNSMAFGGPPSRGSPSAPLPPALHHGGFSAFGVPGQPPAKSSPSQQNPQQQQQFQQQAQAQAQQQRQQQGQPNTVGPAAWAYANAQLNSYAAAQRQRQPTGGEQSNNSNAAAAYYAPSPSSQQHSNTSSVSSPIIGGIGGGAGGGASAFASTQLSQLPPGMADLGALNLHSAASSQPVSAASSPGWQHRRLPSAGAGTVHHTVGGGSGSTNYEHNAPSHNPRVAASSVTGKRLNWGEMICATIAHSEHGRLVIQDLFEQMCARFPEVQEWAFGKDWEVSLGTTTTTKGQTRRRYTTPGADRREIAHLRTLTNILGSPNLSFVQARVKNRIKSTLSIKGHLFVKVPRPSSAAGKGSWWTLSQEAQDAYHEGRLGPLLKLSGTMPVGGTSTPGHSRGGSVSENLTMTSTDSRYDSPGPSMGGSGPGTGPTSGVATPLRQHSMPHPLAQHVEAASTSSPNHTPNPAMASGEHSQQAHQAHQLAQLQAQLLRQQQAQREVLPGSYDPNAPPSGSAYFPHHQFYNFEGLGGNGGSSSSGAMLMGGQAQNGGAGVNGGGNGDDSLFSSSMQSIYGTSFGNHMNPGGMAMPPGRFGGNQSMIDMDKMGTSYGDTPMMPASFESGSFGATRRALGGMPPWKGAGMDYRMTPGQPGEGSANGSGMGESNPSGTSASDSIDSASGSSNSGPSGNAPSTGASSWGVGGASWGIGATQSIPHLGGPQSMPFPAAGGSQGAVGRDIPASSARGTSMNSSAGSSNRPGSSDGSTIGNPFDFSSSASSLHGSSAVNGPPGPGGMYPYSFSGLGDDTNGGKGAAVPPNFYGNGGVGGGFFQGGGGAGPHHHHHHHHAGGNNPFGMSIPGGYAMPSAVPINSPYHPNLNQPRLNYLLNTHGGGVNTTGGQTAGGGAAAMDMAASGSGSGAGSGNGVTGGGTDGSASASNTVPPSPADSTSAFFAFTPAAGPVDAPGSSPSRPTSGGEGGAGAGGEGGGGAGAGEEGSALGPLVGKRKVSSAARNLPSHKLLGGGGGGGAAAPVHTPNSIAPGMGTGGGVGGAAREGSGSAAEKGKGGSGMGDLQKVEEGFALPPPATQH